MLILLIILAILAVIILISYLMGGKDSDIKKLRPRIDALVGDKPQDNQKDLEQNKPSFSLAYQNLNPKSIGQKFQHFQGTDKGTYYEITLYYDEQYRCEDYKIDRFVNNHTYNHMKRSFHKSPKVTRRWWGQ